jgi:hypothetical protein
MEPSVYGEQVVAALRATEVHRADSWSWFRDRQTLIDPNLRRALSPELVRAQLVRAIQATLYSHFYCTGSPTPVDPLPAQPSPAPAKAAFVDGLSEANRGAGYVEGGWELAGGGESPLVIQRGGLALVVDDDGAPGAGSRGASVTRRMPNELRFASPGFYLAMGNELLSAQEHEPFVRWYWHLRPEGAARLVDAVTTTLNDERLPFRLKLVNDPSRYARCDAAVLYTARDDLRRLGTILESIHGDLAAYVEDDVPAFTKPLADGLAVAEGPPNGASFGEHRCGLLADGIVRAFEAKRRALDERLAAVRERFAREGISLERPFLNPGSEDVFRFDARAPRRVVTSDPEPDDSPVARDALLRTATEIGELVAGSAIWHGGRCNWLSLGSAPNGARNPEPPRLVYRALGPELYAGTSGVALFLAELHAATGAAGARRAALGACRQSLSVVGTKVDSLGLYEGALGIALVAAYVGRLLDEAELLDGARAAVRIALARAREYDGPDLISGHAGAVAALLILTDLLDDPDLTRVATRLGGDLMKRADREERHISWSSASSPRQRNLLGVSHGTAGVAYALLELFRATQSPEYRDAAELAFAYERRWHDAEAGNWPDFRLVPARSRRRALPSVLPVFWCHGAAGIALSRIHAHRVLGDETLLAEAVTGLTTTRVWTERMLPGRRVGFSLCHGLAGNADVLAAGSRALGDPAGSDVAAKVAAAGIRLYAAEEHRWPLDPLGSRAPGLMLGLSGVGHFYLRLYDPDIPSVLLPDRETIVRRLARGG